jgi:hypothetical protein
MDARPYTIFVVDRDILNRSIVLPNPAIHRRCRRNVAVSVAVWLQQML